MRGTHTLLSAAAILLVLSSPVFAYRDVIDLGTFFGGTESCAYSINNKGQIVGYAYEYSNQIACLFDPTGRGFNKRLAYSSVAYSINNNGQIVGINAAVNEACLFDSTGNYATKMLGTLGGIESCARSVNNNGRIVGWSDNAYGFTRGCRFDSTGGGANQDLFALLSGYYYKSVANCVNNYNKIVGWMDDRYENQRACLFNTGAPNQSLGTLNGFSSASVANFINDNGQIIGYAANNSGYTRACFFNPDNSALNINLGTLGGNYSEALAISNNGQIVGNSYDIFGQRHACLFDPTGLGNNTDLNSLIDPSANWVLKYAYSTNDSGWIVGQGTHNGYERAFLLTPEPTTLLLFGLSGLILRRRKSS
jgi:probable HAF family extracellular repeat protein